MSTTLKYIDNSFYRISPSAAKRLSVDGKLPLPGWQKPVVLDRLHDFTGEHDGELLPMFNRHLRSAWLQETVVAGKRVLALTVYYAPYPIL